jgi:serine/threonine protein kinase
MTERVRKELNGKELDSLFCEKRGLRLFDPFFFRKIEVLGSGAFGSVEKCLDIRDRKMVAVKKIKIKGEKDYEGNISSYLVETEMLKRIKESDHPNLAKMIGEFYESDSMGIIESLILVTEAGDFSLKEIMNCRLSMRTEEEKKKKKSAYEPEEIIGFLKQIIPAYQELKKLDIYHSDTKLENIIYSKEKKGFIIIDFGVANIVRGDLSDGVKLSDFVRGGTKGYNSPEKKIYFDKEDKIEEVEDCFDPFKCDMWALGVCIKKMAGNIDINSSKGILIEKIKYKLMETNWRVRYDVDDLAKLIHKENIVEINFEISEKKFLEKLEEERRKNFSDMIDLFQKAYMPVEELKMAKLEKEDLEKRLGKLNDENSKEYELNLKHLGKKKAYIKKLLKMIICN